MGNCAGHVSIKREYGTSFKIVLRMEVDENLRLFLRSSKLLGLEWAVFSWVVGFSRSSVGVRVS